MPALYSLDLRQKAIAALEAGHSKAAVSRLMGISRATLTEWHHRYRIHGGSRVRLSRTCGIKRPTMCVFRVVAMLISPMSSNPRLPLSALACVNSRCDVYGQPGGENLIVRKIYGKDNIRYLRCRCCGEEFSERKGTALWNTKISEERAIAVGRQLAEGTSLKGTSRLTHSHRDTVRRLIRKFGEHAERFHNQKAQQLDIEVLEMDERHGFVESKAERCWDAVAIAAASKFIVQVEVGPRTQPLFERLMHSSAARLAHPQDLVLMTDGEACYRTLFPIVFGVPYLPPGVTHWAALLLCATASPEP